MEILKDIVTIAGTIAAAIFGFVGLKMWRMQLRSTNNNDLARKILVALYKVKLSVMHLRRPFREVSIPDDKRFNTEAQNEAFAKQYQEEWDRLRNDRIELQVACVEAQALWDKGFLSNLVPLNQCITELEMHLQEYLRSKTKLHAEPMFDRKETHKIIFGLGTAQDEFGTKFDTAIDDIDGKVRPHLQKESFFEKFF